MDDFVQSIKAYLYDKAISPLFWTFIFAWIGWNYKFIVVLFSELAVEGKLTYISYVLYPDIAERLLAGFLYPFSSTLLFIFIYPFLSQPVYKFVRYRQKKLLDIKREVENETLLTEKDSRELRKMLFEREQSYEKLIDEQNQVIKNLRDAITSVQEKRLGLASEGESVKQYVYKSDQETEEKLAKQKPNSESQTSTALTEHNPEAALDQNSGSLEYIKDLNFDKIAEQAFHFLTLDHINVLDTINRSGIGITESRLANEIKNSDVPSAFSKVLVDLKNMGLINYVGRADPEGGTTYVYVSTHAGKLVIMKKLNSILTQPTFTLRSDL